MSSSKKVVKKSKKTVVKKAKKDTTLYKNIHMTPLYGNKVCAAYEHANELGDNTPIIVKYQPNTVISNKSTVIPSLILSEPETSTVPPTLADEKLYEDQCQMESIKNPNLYWKGVMDLAGLELAIVALVLMLIWVYSVTWR